MSNLDRLQAQPDHGGNLLWAAQVANCSPSNILDVSANINPLGPPESAIAAIQYHLGSLRSYPNPSYRGLRQAIGRFHTIDPEWIVPGNGAAELLTWIGRDLATSSSSDCPSVNLMTPAFGDYERALAAFDANIIRHSLDLESLSVPRNNTTSQHEAEEALQSVGLCDVLQEAVTPPSPGCSQSPPSHHKPIFSDALLLNNPHNPTGALFSSPSIEENCQHLERIVIDEAFMDFLRPAQQQSLVNCVESSPNLVVLRSLTKFYSCPGLRIGYAIAHPDHIKKWQQWRDPWPVNTLAEAAAIAVLQDSEFQEQTWQWLVSARSQLFKGLSGIPGLTPLPGAANFLLVRSHCSVAALQQWLLRQHRILIRDCASFPELGDRYFRIAVRTNEDNATVLNALAEAMQNCMPSTDLA